ncbi:hypothetical protein [Sphingobium sp. CAP-1]|uniref:hypothetical protein n=1 Tax=Sphingobium sp. CAP-1 TaxID=2676077 RepID=UPI001E494A7F|nr:hypothetical protein [Sphingobium sp. CAP-1]
MTLSLLIALAAAAATHSVSIEHHGQQLGATYTARTEMRSRTVGAKAPNRMDAQRCHWTATVVVDRKLDHGPALARTIATDKRFSGSEAGACTPGRNSGARNLAQYQDKIEAHLVEVANADRGPLLAELDSVRALASN